MNASELEAWFVREVLPLEAALTHFLRHSWRNQSDIADLRQDVYAQVCEAAKKRTPDPVKPFVFAVARNLVINRVRRERVIPIEAVADPDALGVAMDMPGPDRNVIARDELLRLRAAIDRLPPRCREAVIMARLEGLTGRAIAARMGVSESAVSHHVENGMRAIADMLYGEDLKS
ncbi:MAG TPA: sigma-70 family RNA polymerase sigma factor [Rhizomicrobium sp.]|nr:sigma-70 family RNA polymerase sigma factor [Rhizomicrobium sp.]